MKVSQFNLGILVASNQRVQIRIAETMPKRNSPGEVPENNLLAALPSHELERLLPHLETVDLSLGSILYDFDDAITHLYFPNRSCIVSMLCTSERETQVEVALIGNEGVAALNNFLGPIPSPVQYLVQSPGTATRLSLAAMKAECDGGGKLQALLLRFSGALMSQIAQTALCNHVHTNVERLARWLLLSHDRSESDLMPLSHDLIAKMLNWNTAGVKRAIGNLRTCGIVRYNGTELKILDREVLENVACACYAIVKNRYRDEWNSNFKENILVIP